MEQLDLEIQRRTTEGKNIGQQLERALYLRRLDPFVFPLGSSGFNQVYTKHFDTGMAIDRNANEDFRANIRNHVFAEVTVERINNIRAPETKRRIISLLNATFDDFKDVIEAALLSLETTLDGRKINSLMVTFGRFDNLKPLCAEGTIVDFDVETTKSEFHQRLVDILNTRLDGVETNLRDGKYSEGSVVNDNVTAALKTANLYTNPLYAAVVVRLTAFEKVQAASLIDLVETYRLCSVDEIITTKQPLKIFVNLGTSLLNSKIDNSVTLWERLKDILVEKFVTNFTSKVTAKPLGSFDEAFYLKMDNYVKACPQDLAQVLETKLRECKMTVRTKITQELALIQQYCSNQNYTGLREKIDTYAAYTEPAISPELTRELNGSLEKLERVMNASLIALNKTSKKDANFNEFQRLFHSLQLFYDAFTPYYAEKTDSTLQQVRGDICKRLKVECAALGDAKKVASAKSALAFLTTVVDSYDAEKYQKTVYDYLPVKFLPDATGLKENVGCAYGFFVANFKAENDTFAELRKKNQTLAKKCFDSMKSFEPFLVEIKHAAETSTLVAEFFQSDELAFLKSWVNLSSKFDDLVLELQSLSNSIRTQNFLDYQFVDSQNKSQLMERDGSTEIAEFYSTMFDKLNELTNTCASIALHDPNCCDTVLRQCGDFLNAQCNLVKIKMKEVVNGTLHLATKSDDFRTYNMCFNNLLGMQRHNFGKFVETMKLFPGVEKDIADCKTATMLKISGSIEHVNMIILEISQEGVKFNNDREIREKYAIPMYREVLRIHLYSVNIPHLSAPLQNSLNQIFNNMKNASDKGRKLIIYLGTYLKVNTDGMDPQGLGLDVMETYQCFDNFMNSVFDSRTKAQDIKYVLDNLRVNAGSQFSRSDIESYYAIFNDTFYSTMTEHLIATEEHIDAIVYDIMRIAQGFRVGQIHSNHNVIPPVLAKIFALWSLMSAGQVDVSETSTVTEFHKKPHPVQIVAIFQMLGMSGSMSFMQKVGVSSQNMIANHFVQIGTGEGKSVVLAMTSIILALFQYDVNCASYSSLLSERDYDACLCSRSSKWRSTSSMALSTPCARM